MIRVGPAGWSYRDWYGYVYPEKKPSDFDELGYLSRYFDTVEINSSYYGAPRPSTARKWLMSVADNRQFKFCAKLFHAFTHERNPASGDEMEFREGIAPLAEAGRLGALLMQFPWSFKSSPENRKYLVDLIRRFSEYPVVIEVRHASWLGDNILDLLGEIGAGICNIDQPLFHRSVKPSAHVTSPTGYVRLHGRNYKNWFSSEAGVRGRYDHLYTPDELDPWIGRARQISEEAEEVYVIANNHNLGKAVVNALEISSVLKGRPVPAPRQLVTRYSDLQEFVRAEE
jgi:uncharacterized protein YecE (DUF72 family)